MSTPPNASLTKPTAHPTRWEYTERYAHEDENVASVLARLGLDGWELVTAFRDKHRHVTYYCKRPLA